MSDGEQAVVERIAREGQAIVVERLRSAFAHQAATRSHAVEIDPAGLEALVEAAAQRAGGALWRRSLAEAAAGALGLGLAEAVSHPAVIAAHELVGAPPYVSPGTAARQASPEPAAQPPSEAISGPSGDPHSEQQTDEFPEEQAEEPIELDEPEPDGGPEALPAEAPESQALRLAAVHVTGIETLRPGDRDIELRLSHAGLDVLKRSSGIAIGRLDWAEIETIELPSPRRGLRGRRRSRELVVSTGRGQAQFELSGLSESDLREHVEPLLARLHPAASAGRR